MEGKCLEEVFEVEVCVPGVGGVFSSGDFEGVALDVRPVELDGGNEVGDLGYVDVFERDTRGLAFLTASFYEHA